MKKYTWDEIYERAIDKVCFSSELKAKDEARWQVKDYAIEHGYEDPEDAECPEEIIADYCNMFGIMFDEKGNILGSYDIANHAREKVSEQCEKYKWTKDCE